MPTSLDSRLGRSQDCFVHLAPIPNRCPTPATSFCLSIDHTLTKNTALHENRCICGRATLEDAFYCSMACKKNDFVSTLASSASLVAAAVVEPSFSSLPSPTTPVKLTPIPLTFTFHCSGKAPRTVPTPKPASMACSFPSANKPDFSSDVVVVNGFLEMRPRMNSVDTPPASPILKVAFNNGNCSAESCYARLAFNSRKKRDS